MKISPGVVVALLLGACLSPIPGLSLPRPPTEGPTQPPSASAPPGRDHRSSVQTPLEIPSQGPVPGVSATPSLPAASPGCGGPSGLSEILQSVVSSAPPGEWEVYLHDLEGGTIVNVGADQPLHPASTIKVAIAIAFLRWSESQPGFRWTSGPVAHQRSFEQLLRAMVVISEEDATASLTDFLMQQEKIDLNREVQSWGATQTTVVPRSSTAQDLGLILERLAEGELLSPAGTDYLLGLMRTPTPSKETRLGAGLPVGPRNLLAHKTGTTFEQGLGVVADTGYVQWQGARYVIVVLSNRVPWVDYSSAMALITEISQVAFACLVPGGSGLISPHRGGPAP